MASPDCWLPPVRASFRAYSYCWMLRWRWRYSIGKAKARCMWPPKAGPTGFTTANPPSEKSEVLGKGSDFLEKIRHVGWFEWLNARPQVDTLKLCDCWYMPMEMWKEQTMPVWLRRTMRSFMVTHRLYVCCANCGDGQSASGVKERWTKNLTAKGRGWLDDCDGWSSFKDVLIFFIPYLADLTSRRVTHIWWWKLELQRRADLYTSHKARPWNRSRVLRRCLKKVRLGDAVLGVLCFVVVVVVVAAGVVVVVVVVVGKFQVMSSGWVFDQCERPQLFGLSNHLPQLCVGWRTLELFLCEVTPSLVLMGHCTMPGVFLRSFLMALSAEDPDCEVQAHTLKIAPLPQSPKAPFLPMPVAEETI